MKFFFVISKFPGDPSSIYSRFSKKKKVPPGKLFCFIGKPIHSFFNGGGGGSNSSSKNVFWDDGFKKINISLFLIICLVFYKIFLFLLRGKNDFVKKRAESFANFLKENWIFRIITGNCELPTSYFFCIFLQNFPSEKMSIDHQKRIVSGINRWYRKKNFIFSKFNSEKISVLKNEKRNMYFSDEPRIGRISFLTKRKQKKQGIFKEKKTKFFILKRILKIYPGHNFKWDQQNWERFFRETLFKDGELSINSFKLSGNPSFLNIFVTMSETPSIKIEPEILMSNGCLSGSISADDTNFLGLGLIFKNKFSKNDNNRTIFQSQLSSHFSDFGKIIFSKESKKKATDNLTFNFSGEVKIVGGSFNLNLLRKNETYSKKKRGKILDIFSLSLFPKQIKTDRNFFLSSEISIYSVNKIKEGISTGFQLLFGAKKKVLSIFQNPTNIEIKLLNFFKYRPNLYFEFFNTNTEIFGKGINSYPGWEYKEFKKKIFFGVTSILEKRFSSSILLEIGKYSDNKSKTGKNITLGIDFENILLVNITLTGNGSKKISMGLR